MATKNKFFAVMSGRKIGVFPTEEAMTYVFGFKGCNFRGFKTFELALNYFLAHAEPEPDPVQTDETMLQAVGDKLERRLFSKIKTSLGANDFTEDEIYQAEQYPADSAAPEFLSEADWSLDLGSINAVPQQPGNELPAGTKFTLETSEIDFSDLDDTLMLMDEDVPGMMSSAAADQLPQHLPAQGSGVQTAAAKRHHRLYGSSGELMRPGRVELLVSAPWMNKLQHELDYFDLLAFTDGSTKENVCHESFGAVLVDRRLQQFHLNGCYDSRDVGNSYNAEITAVLSTLQWGVMHGFHKIKVFYDNLRVGGIVDALIEPTNPAERHLLRMTSLYRYAMDIELCFQKVKAHSGIELHDRADLLAKAAGCSA